MATPSGPKPNVDFNIGDMVKDLSSGLVGKIVGWERPNKGEYIARIQVKGIPGGTTASLGRLEKIAQWANSGRPARDLNRMPGEEKLKGGFQCPQCGSQLPNPGNHKNQIKGRPAQCANCGRHIDGKERWVSGPQDPAMQKKFNPPGMQISSQYHPDPNLVMPTDEKVVNNVQPETMKRRTKRIMLSDENAENIDEDHIANCCESANSLAIGE